MNYKKNLSTDINSIFDPKPAYFTDKKKYQNIFTISPTDRTKLEFFDESHVHSTPEQEKIKLLIKNRDLFGMEELERLDEDREYQIGKRSK